MLLYVDLVSCSIYAVNDKYDITVKNFFGIDSKEELERQLKLRFNEEKLYVENNNFEKVNLEDVNTNLIDLNEKYEYNYTYWYCENPHEDGIKNNYSRISWGDEKYLEYPKGICHVGCKGDYYYYPGGIAYKLKYENFTKEMNDFFMHHNGHLDGGKFNDHTNFIEMCEQYLKLGNNMFLKDNMFTETNKYSDFEIEERVMIPFYFHSKNEEFYKLFTI